MQKAAANWLARQGTKSGFEIAEGIIDEPWSFDDEAAGVRRLAQASNCTQVAVERHGSKGHRPAGISLVDIAGEIRITDPDAFLERLPLGFGSAEAFGCGPMLIRRAH